jgi:F0F1-type ATP synthase delta subunit
MLFKESSIAAYSTLSHLQQENIDIGEAFSGMKNVQHSLKNISLADIILFKHRNTVDEIFNNIVDKKHKSVQKIIASNISQSIALRGDFSLFSEIIDKIANIANIMHVVIKSAVALDVKILENIKILLQDKYCRPAYIELITDSSLIDGAILYIGSQKIDLSLIGAVNNLQQKLLNI